MKYSDSGVDIDRANRAKQRIRQLARSTFNSSVVQDIGAFAGLFRPDLIHFQKPVLVASADGVGTKLKIAFQSGQHRTVGSDLVAHCINDILAQGAFPLFFLDYIAAAHLEPEVIEQLVEGLARACKESNCVLLGGETAEMPEFYYPGEYDLAGFIVGIADESKLMDPRRVEKGDVLIGLPSLGLHTNGYSLARKVFFEKAKLNIDAHVPELGRSVAEELLAPHRNYLHVVKELVMSDDLNGIAHITGGGITENLPRALPGGLDALVRRGTWEIPPIFRFIREKGNVEVEEMYRTFNMGLGLILIVARNRSDRVQEFLRRRDEIFFVVGETAPGEGKVKYA